MLTTRHKRQKIVSLLFSLLTALSCQVVIFSLKFPLFSVAIVNPASAAVVTGKMGNRDTIRMCGVHMGEFLDEQCAS
jgi:hypothetical protein